MVSSNSLRHRLVQDQQVDLVDPELAGALVEGVQGGVVPVVADPDLGLDEDLAAVEPGSSEPFAHLPLVAVRRGGVDVPVTRCECCLDGCDRLVGRRLEDAVPERGQRDAVVEGEDGDSPGRHGRTITLSASRSSMAAYASGVSSRPTVRSKTLPGLDGAVQHGRQQPLDVGADRGGATGQGDVRAEEAAEADRGVVVLRDADPADDAARPDDADGLLVGRQVADRLEDDLAAAVGEVADLGDARRRRARRPRRWRRTLGRGRSAPGGGPSARSARRRAAWPTARRAGRPRRRR